VGDLVKERIGAWAAGLFLAAFGLGMCLAVPALWCVVLAGVVVWIWRNERRMQHAANPAPPPGSEGADSANPQFSYVEDTPGHWAVTRAEDEES
jgi:uncharacterized membrane protein